MKLVLLLVLVAWLPSAWADGSIVLNFYLNFAEANVQTEIPVARLVFHPADHDRQVLSGKQFHLRPEGAAGTEWMALKVRDLDGSAAVLEYLVRRVGERELKLYVDEGDIQVSSEFPESPPFIVYNWESLRIQLEDQLVELKELVAYLRYKQGLFNRDYDRTFVYRTLNRYFIAQLRPHFGRWERCDRMLAHFPWYDPRR